MIQDKLQYAVEEIQARIDVWEEFDDLSHCDIKETKKRYSQDVDKVNEYLNQMRAFS